MTARDGVLLWINTIRVYSVSLRSNEIIIDISDNVMHVTHVLYFDYISVGYCNSWEIVYKPWIVALQYHETYIYNIIYLI